MKISDLSIELSNYIVDNYEEKILRKIINTDYGHFMPYEQEEIYKISLKNRPEYNDLIAREMHEYLKDNDTIILDGFVNFRLKDYRIALTETIEKAVSEFEVKREYETFIGLLRYFVDMQQPRHNTINLIGCRDGKVKVLDEKRTEICSRIDDADVLLDLTLTNAPRKIAIHRIENFKNEEVLNTIMKVFAGKTTICKKCRLCATI